MPQAKISLQARSSCDTQGIALNFWFDGELIQTMPLSIESQTFEYLFVDDENIAHCFEIELQGKRAEHTKIDNDGKILSDVVAEIKDFALDEIPLGHMFYEHAQYHHDYNGTTDLLQDEFFGTMGCNGRVSLKFHSPVYSWLLENM